MVDVTLWTGASVDLADDPLLWSEQALFLEHQRVDSGSQPPFCELDTGSLGPKSTPAPLRLRHWPPHMLPHVPS